MEQKQLEWLFRFWGIKFHLCMKHEKKIYAKWATGVVLVWWTCMEWQNTPYTSCNEILPPLWRNSDARLLDETTAGLLSGPLNLVEDVSGCSPGKSTAYLIFFSHALCPVLVRAKHTCMSYFMSFFFYDFLRHRRYFPFGRQKKFLF